MILKHLKGEDCRAISFVILICVLVTKIHSYFWAFRIGIKFLTTSTT